MSLTIFLPVRKGSERVEEKNTKPFAGIFDGLLHLKLSQLQKVSEADEILVSTNDPKCVAIAEKFRNKINNLKIDIRPEKLGNSATNLSDLIKYAGSVINSENILWTHVTSPFFDEDCYSNSIKEYKNRGAKGYDSLITGSTFKEFLLDKNSGKLVNNQTSLNWPRTQELEEWFKINNAAFISPTSFYKEGERTGKRPFLMEYNEVESMDIDTLHDFEIAEAVYERIYR